MLTIESGGRKRKGELSPAHIERDRAEAFVLNAGTLKERILDKLNILEMIGVPVTRSVFKHLEAVEHSYAEVESFSKEAGDFFQQLIPRTEGNPHAKRMSRSHGLHSSLVNKEEGRFVPRLVNREIIREHLERFFKESLFRTHKEPYDTGVTQQVERSFGEEVLMQRVTRAVWQDGGENMLYEHVENELRKDAAGRRTEAGVVIQDLQTGVALDVAELLPTGFRLSPGFMERFGHRDKDEHNSVDLQTYGGLGVSNSAESAFFMDPGERVVAYGSLSRKGGTLSLFHEIAHAWQNHHGGGINAMYKGKPEFRTHLEACMLLITDLEITKLELWAARIQKLSDAEKRSAARIQDILNNFSRMGVEPLSKEGELITSTDSPVHEEGVINIQSVLNTHEGIPSKRYYPVKSQKLKDAMSDFIAEERDAWAHALRTVRFLRQKGLDVEPELKTLADVQAYIGPCLGSYQKRLDREIELHPDDYRFSRVQEG